MSDVARSNRDINSLTPIAQKAAKIFLDTCKRENIDIFVTEYYRSQERQDYLYCQGRTVSDCVKVGISKSFAEKYCRAGNQVTWTRNSNHMGGYAWDIAVNPPHDLYDSKIISKAGEIAKDLGIEWGGTWKEKDTPHFQINKNWKPPKEMYNVGEIEINLNGKIKKVSAINKDGHNYIKLQDLRDSKINIGYDDKLKMPLVYLSE